MNSVSRRSFAPQGWRTITPRIVVRQPEALVAFIKHVFGATGRYRTDRPAVLELGDSMLMISDAMDREPIAAFLYVYVDDVDETYRLTRADMRSIPPGLQRRQATNGGVVAITSRPRPVARSRRTPDRSNSQPFRYQPD